MNRILIYLSVFIIVSVTSVTLPPSALPAEEADKICPRCNAVYPADSNFCTTDGTALVEQEVVLQCPKCGRMGRIAEIFCPLDGERMTPAGEKVRERRAKEKALAIEYYKEGNKLSDQRDYDKALEKYLEAERLYPDFPELQHNMGWACSKLGNLPDAVYHLRRYINL
ncbi:MAG: double zinc ribbon domain-containing protein, partial [Candidatus Bathyanammoxibius sp.]